MYGRKTHDKHFLTLGLYENFPPLTNFALKLFFTGADRGNREIEPRNSPKRRKHNKDSLIAAGGLRKEQR